MKQFKLMFLASAIFALYANTADACKVNCGGNPEWWFTWTNCQGQNKRSKTYSDEGDRNDDMKKLNKAMSDHPCSGKTLSPTFFLYNVNGCQNKAGNPRVAVTQECVNQCKGAGWRTGSFAYGTCTVYTGGSSFRCNCYDPEWSYWTFR